MSDHLTGPMDQSPLIIGHRGAAGLAPENTLPSFTLARKLGVQAVELDVHVCQGELVVIHDATLERTTNGAGAVSDATLTTLRGLDAGDGAHIPTLTEVFDLLPDNVAINIELKGQGTAPLLADWLPGPGSRAVLISSFEHEALRQFRQIRQDYPVAPLFGRWRNSAVEIARDFGGGYINVGRKIATPGRLKKINQAGLRALIYTVNELDEAEKLIRAGAWGLFTDFPDRISRASLTAALQGPGSPRS